MTDLQALQHASRVLEKKLKEWTKGPKAALKACRELAKLKDPLDAPLHELHKTLCRIHLSDPEVEEDRTLLCSQLEELMVVAQRERQLRFGTQLHQAAEAAGIPCRKLADSPLEFLLAPLTARVDLQQGTVELCYARQGIGQCQAAAGKVLETHGKLLAVLQKGSGEPKDIFSKLWQAYVSRLARTRQSPGGRVEIVALLPELTMLHQKERFFLNPRPAAFRPYTRAQLAYDLHRLRQARMLEHQGLRLDLGTATGGSTRDKSRVLFVETGPAEGQYYLTLRFVTTGMTDEQ